MAVANESVIGFVAGPVLTPPEVFRRDKWSETNGATGIADAPSLRVRAQATPTTSVRVYPGGFTIAATPNGTVGYADAPRQSYGATIDQTRTVPIRATNASGTRTDVVGIIISDPQYEGVDLSTIDWANHKFWDFHVVEGTSNTRPEQFNLGRPFLPLAQIAIPRSTGTITNAMITDIREVANPRIESVLRARPHSGRPNDEYLTQSRDDGEWFPNTGGEQVIHIPAWATRVQIRATWHAIRYHAGRHGWGEMWVEYGPWVRASTRQYSTRRFMWDTVGNIANTYRTDWSIADDRPVPAALRGTEQMFVLKARRQPEGGDGWVASCDGRSGVSIEVRFLEVPEPSTS